MKRTVSTMEKLTYTNVNGYLIPNLTYKSGEQMEQFGKYGFLRRDYLKNHRNSGYAWKASSGSGQGSQRTGRGNSETVGRKRTTAG